MSIFDCVQFNGRAVRCHFFVCVVVLWSWALTAQSESKAVAILDLDVMVAAAFTDVVANRTTVAGENLQSIAEVAYGSKLLWPWVWYFNRDDLPNPERTSNGINLRVPRLKAGFVQPETVAALNAAYTLVYRQYCSLPGTVAGQCQWGVVQAGSAGGNLLDPAGAGLLDPVDIAWAQERLKVARPLQDKLDSEEYDAPGDAGPVVVAAPADLLAKEAQGKTDADTAGWISLVLGLAGAGLGAYAWFDGQAAYDNYQSATDTTAISGYRSQVLLDQTLLYAGIGVGGAGLLLSPILFASAPAAQAQAQLDDLDRRIQAIKEAGK